MAARTRSCFAIGATLAGLVGCRALLAIEEKELGLDGASLDGGDGASVGGDAADGGTGDAASGACATGKTRCATGCAALGEDPQNCGSCGRSCPMACDTGKCVARVVAMTGGTSVDLAETADALFWTTSGVPRVRRIAKLAGAPETVVSTANPPVGIAVLAPWLYWATTGSPSILRRPLDGGTTSAVVTGLADVAFLAADDATVWFTRKGNPGEVWQAPVTGGSGSVLVGAVSSPLRIVIDAANVYYTAEAAPDLGLWKADKAGAGKVQLYAGKVFALTSDALGLYTFDVLTGAVLRIAKADGAKTILASGETVGGIAVDETSVYWTSFDGTVSRVPKNGGTVQRLAIGHMDAQQIVASDPTTIYWFGGQLIFATPK